MADHQYVMIDLSNDGEPTITFVDLTGDSDEEDDIAVVNSDPGSSDPGSSDSDPGNMYSDSDSGSSDDEQAPIITGPGPVSARLGKGRNWAKRIIKAEPAVGPSPLGELFNNTEGLDMLVVHVDPEVHRHVRLVCKTAYIFYDKCPKVFKVINFNLCKGRTMFHQQQLPFIERIKPAPKELSIKLGSDVNSTILQQCVRAMGMHGMSFNEVSPHV